MPCPPVPTIRAVRLGLLLALATAVPAIAQGTPRSMAECERLKNDLAYNQCLAMFGPPARMVTGGGDGAGGGPAFASSSGPSALAALPNADEPQAEEPKRAGGGRYYGRRGGRQAASFDVGGTAAARSRWRWRRRH